MAELAAHDAAMGEVASDEEYSDESERDDDEEETDGNDDALAVADPATRPTAGLPDVGALRITEPVGEGQASDEEESEEEEEEDSDEGEDDSEEEEESGDEADHDRRQRDKEARPPRIGRRPVRSGNGKRDVEAIVTASLSRSKAQQDRRHHGKKPVSANVLGRQKGSKKKQNANAREARAASKQGGGRGGDFW